MEYWSQDEINIMLMGLYCCHRDRSYRITAAAAAFSMTTETMISGNSALKDILMRDRGGGRGRRIVSVLAFYSDNPSSKSIVLFCNNC